MFGIPTNTQVVDSYLIHRQKGMSYAQSIEATAQSLGLSTGDVEYTVLSYQVELGEAVEKRT